MTLNEPNDQQSHYNNYNFARQKDLSDLSDPTEGKMSTTPLKCMKTNAILHLGLAITYPKSFKNVYFHQKASKISQLFNEDSGMKFFSADLSLLCMRLMSHNPKSNYGSHWLCTHTRQTYSMPSIACFSCLCDGCWLRSNSCLIRSEYCTTATRVCSGEISKSSIKSFTKRSTCNMGNTSQVKQHCFWIRSLSKL